MWNLLRFIFTGDGHAHKWVTDKEATLRQDGSVVGLRVFQHCCVCGKVKKVDLY